MTELNKDLSIETVEDIVLPRNVDYLIAKNSSGFNRSFNVTRRSPRRTGDTTELEVCTSSIKTEEMIDLRVEKDDGMYFLVCDAESKHEKQKRISVESDLIGYQIMKSLLDACEDKNTNTSLGGQRGDLELPEEVWIVNGIIERLAPTIFTCCAIALTFSGTISLLFK